MGKDAERQHTCYAEAVAKGAGYSVESRCQDKATQQFLAEFARAESIRGCGPGTVEGPVVDGGIRAAVSGIRTTISQPATSCAPVEVTTLHGASFAGNSRLARIENGEVGCVHAEEGTLAACAFSTIPGRESGEWLESAQGSFALAGQAISREGVPGGEYIVAAKVSEEGTSACVEPVGMDTVGLICGFITGERDILESGFLVRRAWSNRAASQGRDPCVPGVAERPYVALVPEQPTVRLMKDGDSITIALKAAADRAVARWAVSAVDLTGSQEHEQYVDVVLDKTEVAPGDAATLRITRRKRHPKQLSVVGIVSTIDAHSYLWPVAVVTRRTRPAGHQAASLIMPPIGTASLESPGARHPT